MKKILLLFLVPVCISIATGCRKETTVISDKPTTDGTGLLSASLSADATFYNTKFGVLVNDGTGDEKITVAKKMQAAYVRDAIILESFNGKSLMFEKYQSNGFKVLLNLNNAHVNRDGEKKPNPYPTNMKKYRKSLETVLDKYQPEVVVIENEPANDNRYTGPIENYFTQLKTAVDVCKARGIKITDGALHTGMVCILVYQDYVNKGMQAKADDFANRALSSVYLRAAQGKGSEEMNAKIEKCRKMIDAYRTMKLDYVNIHWYEPMGEHNDPDKSAPGVAKEVADFLKTQTGKPVLTNEFGQTNQSPSLISSMVREFRLAGLAYAIVFSGTGSGGVEAKPLHKQVRLLPNGLAYRDAIAF